MNTKKGTSTKKPLTDKYLKSAVYDFLNYIKLFNRRLWLSGLPTDVDI